MVRGARFLGVAAVLATCGCNGARPEQPETWQPLRAPIIGGRLDSVSHSVVGILTQDSLCSGSLLAPNLVLTARHCVASTGGEQITCGSSRFGPTYSPDDFAVTTDNDLTANGISPLYAVSEIRTSSDRNVCGNDIALMILAQNIPASTATPLVPRLDDRPVASEPFDAVGYGIQDPDDDLGETAGVRMRASGNAVLCVGASACEGTNATNSEWVAEAPICSGDSGGPALDAQGRVIGVASRSNLDCSAGLYEAVDSWKDMIVEAAIDAAAQGGYELPVWAGGEPVPDAGPQPSAGTSGTGGNGAGGTAGAGTGGTGGRAGASSAGSAGTSGSDPTGEPCSTSCPGGFLCYAADGENGVCVPTCSSSDTECPSGFTCDVRLGACEPDEEDRTRKRRRKDDEGCGCRTAPVSSRTDRAWGFLAFAGIIAGTLRRRRRAAR